MKWLLWKLLEWIDNNHGYSTPIQKRYKVGDRCKISMHVQSETKMLVGTPVVIVETGRHDYLVQELNIDYQYQVVVFQYELI